MGNTYSSRGARVTDTTAIAATLIAETERSADLVTRRLMWKWETGKIQRRRQAQDFDVFNVVTAIRLPGARVEAS